MKGMVLASGYDATKERCMSSEIRNVIGEGERHETHAEQRSVSVAASGWGTLIGQLGSPTFACASLSELLACGVRKNAPDTPAIVSRPLNHNVPKRIPFLLSAELSHTVRSPQKNQSMTSHWATHACRGSV